MSLLPGTVGSFSLFNLARLIYSRNGSRGFSQSISIVFLANQSAAAASCLPGDDEWIDNVERSAMWPVAAILFGVYIPPCLSSPCAGSLISIICFLCFSSPPFFFAVHPSVRPSVSLLSPSDRIPPPRAAFIFACFLGWRAPLLLLLISSRLGQQSFASPRAVAVVPVTELAEEPGEGRKDAGSEPQGQEGREAGVGEGGAGAGGGPDGHRGREHQQHQGPGGGGVGGAAGRDAGAEAGDRRRGRRGDAGEREAGADDPGEGEGEAHGDDARDLHQLGGVLRGAEEAGGGQDGAPPRRPEGAVQGQGARRQGVPGHGRGQGPVQGGGGGGPRGPRAAAHRGAPQRPTREGRQGRCRRHRRGRQARAKGGVSGRVGAQGREGGGERRGAGDGAAHERAAQARRRRRRRRRQGAAPDAGEARAEVRGDAGRRGRQERRHRPQIRRDEGRRRQ